MILDRFDFYSVDDGTERTADGTAAHLGASKAAVQVALEKLREKKLISEQYHDPPVHGLATTFLWGLAEKHLRSD